MNLFFKYMNELGEEERRKLVALFEGLDDRDIRYVVLRKYEGLPERVEDDVDVLIHAQDFDRALGVAREIGFERAHGGISVPHALRTAVRAPLSTTKKGVGIVRNALVSRPGEQRARRDEPIKRKLEYGALEIDAVNHLACPEGSAKSVPQPVEDAMLARRRRAGAFYVPADIDALAHYVVHCLVDYEGAFPPYYVAKCNRLAERIAHDAGKHTEFRQLMEILFGEMADPVTARVLSGAFDRLQEILDDEINDQIVGRAHSRPSSPARS